MRDIRKWILAVICPPAAVLDREVPKEQIQQEQELLPSTVPAFLKAIELGVDAIELDLCISKDNRVVVSHDPYMHAGLCASPDGKVLGNSSCSC